MRDDRGDQEDRARDQTGSAGDNIHTLSDVQESELETEESVHEQDLCHAIGDKADYEAMVGLREARKKLQHATTSKRFYKEGDNGRELVTWNRSKFIQVLKKVTTCNRCGAFDHWEDECPHKGHRWRSSPSDRSSGSGRFRKQSSSRNSSLKGKGQRQRSESQV